ncbi:RNA polymerase sigma factor [Candidimonas sp. SYP-B2681]|uniref:RNA polymerase sigma factor n=1 Tax=Candidimonas sp. SYP-B2681 TaxID=2497686 RepID=UPI000F888870|nr:RNA polymerase sigma factor [Candidimonas sp. SYP-B2681]RTZ44748.1 RNA polymerase sigma factor [Candidimonas sp. SYP-B2681]
MPLALVKNAEEKCTDAQLALRVANDDRTALQALMRRHNQRLYRVARSILRNDADAEEVVQETFYKAYRAISRFRGDSALSTWLVRIAVNESNRRLRKINRLSTWLEFSNEAGRDDAAINMITDEFSSSQPEPALSQVQIRNLLETRIDRLPDLFRAVFVLRAVEELSVEETSVCLGIPPATVRSRYFRARKLLRESLQSEVGASIDTAFAFAGDRCDRIVAAVLARLEKTTIHRK